MSESKLTYILKKEDEELALRSLLRREFGVSTRFLRKLKDEDRIFLDGKNVKAFEQGKKGQVLEIRMPEETSWFEPEDIPIDILYEDEDLIVVNKQPGLVVHPTNGKPNGTMVNGLAKRMMDREEQYKIRLVNRLDMDTSGICIVAKNSYCQDFFMKQMQKNQVEKAYVAFVNGTLTGAGTVDLPIGRKENDPWRRAVCDDGAPSVTHFRSLSTFEKNYSLVELVLETGRTHQIRVHMSHLGYPLISDHLYGQGEAEHHLIPRQALHAYKISFVHPRTKERMTVEAPMPEDMIRLRKLLGKEYKEG